MSKTLSKEDLKAIAELVQKQLAPVEAGLRREIEVQGKRYSGLLDGLRTEIRLEMRDLAQHFNQSQAKLRDGIRQDLAEHQDEILKAISELILEDKIASLEKNLEQVKTRLTALEGAR